jgi:AcrR family transcriptional regulator
MAGIGRNRGAMTPPDRRVRRTRRALQQALIELIVERGYPRTTVQDVLDRADVGRSTFYAHFRDKDALIASCFDDLRDDLARALANMEDHQPAAVRDPARPVGVMFEHAYRNRQVYQAVGTEHLHPMILEALREHLCTHDLRLPVEVVAQYHAAALVGLLGWWVRAGFPYGPAEMARMCRETAAPGVTAAVVRAH